MARLLAVILLAGDLVGFLRDSKISEILESFGKARTSKISEIFGVGSAINNLGFFGRAVLSCGMVFCIIYLSLIICAAIRQRA